MRIRSRRFEDLLVPARFLHTPSQEGARILPPFPGAVAPRIPPPTRLSRVLDHRPGEAPYYHFRTFPEIASSGSSQFDAGGLEAICARIRDFAPASRIVVFDLRQESHGLLHDGTPVSWRSEADHNWANRSKSHTKVMEDENARLHGLGETEAALCRRVGVDHQRFFVTDHMKPDDKTVDAFVQLLKANEGKDVWYHFHCKAGKGRTTTFLVLKEIFDRRNEPTSLEAIVEKHVAKEGVDVLAKREKSDYTYALHRARERLIRDFYSYCHTTSLDEPFSAWRMSKAKRAALLYL
jgi:protein-tyrosine phosphatase